MVGASALRAYQVLSVLPGGRSDAEGGNPGAARPSRAPHPDAERGHYPIPAALDGKRAHEQGTFFAAETRGPDDPAAGSRPSNQTARAEPASARELTARALPSSEAPRRGRRRAGAEWPSSTMLGFFLRIILVRPGRPSRGAADACPVGLPRHHPTRRLTGPPRKPLVDGPPAIDVSLHRRARES